MIKKFKQNQKVESTNYQLQKKLMPDSSKLSLIVRANKSTNDAPEKISWLEKFNNLPISRKQLIALIACELISIIGIGIGSSKIIIQGLRSQLLEQAQSELAVSDINYNIKIDQMGTDFRAHSDNNTIIKAAQNHQSNKILDNSLRTEIKRILINETETQNIEYATLVGKDLRILVNANTDRSGEVFNPDNLVSEVLNNSQQIKANSIVSASELSQESPSLPKDVSNQDALIRYTVTPVKDPNTQEVIGALVSGDIVNTKDSIPRRTLSAVGGGYSGIYLRKPTGEFGLVTSLNQSSASNLDNAVPNVELPPSSQSLLQAAVVAKGEIITDKIAVRSQNYTTAAKAIPNKIITTNDGRQVNYYNQPVAILVRGTPQTALNNLLTRTLLQQALVIILTLVVIGIWAEFLRRAIVKPIDHLHRANHAKICRRRSHCSR